MILSLRLTAMATRYTSESRFFFFDFTPISSPSSSASRSGSAKNLLLTLLYHHYTCTVRAGTFMSLPRIIAAICCAMLYVMLPCASPLNTLLRHSTTMSHSASSLRREGSNAQPLGGGEGNDGLADGVGQIELVVVGEEAA